MTAKKQKEAVTIKGAILKVFQKKPFKFMAMIISFIIIVIILISVSMVYEEDDKGEMRLKKLEFKTPIDKLKGVKNSTIKGDH